MRAPFTAEVIAGPEKKPPCGPGTWGLAGPVDAACLRVITYAPWRVYLNRTVINRAASSDWPGPIWQTIAVAAWGWSNCAAEPLRSPETIATEAIPSASNREISDIAPWDWGAKT